MGKLFLLCSDFLFFILIPSGRIRSAARIRSRIVILLASCRLAFLASSRTRFLSPGILSSAVSSIVIRRSPGGIKADSAFKKVVFPAEVPPPIINEYPHRTSCCKKAAVSSSSVPMRNRSSISIARAGNLRIVNTGPSTATGGSAA